MNTPLPVVAPAPPKLVTAPAAPQVVNLAKPMAASVVNNSAHPSAVQLGHPDSPVAVSDRPAVATPVNLSRGMVGMNPANNGGGPPATKVNLGSGSPASTSMKGNGVVAVAGIPHGDPNSNGPRNGAGGPAQVNIGQIQQPQMPKPAATAAVTQRSGPKVLFKPKPEYTAEAIRLHIEGTVTLSIRVSANGSVQVLGITSPLGHGLDEAAMRAVQGTKFQPAVDASGNPVPWEGVVSVVFQLA
jgi:TonB family protein